MAWTTQYKPFSVFCRWHGWLLYILLAKIQAVLYPFPIQKNSIVCCCFYAPQLHLITSAKMWFDLAVPGQLTTVMADKLAAEVYRYVALHRSRCIPPIPVPSSIVPNSSEPRWDRICADFNLDVLYQWSERGSIVWSVMTKLMGNRLLHFEWSMIYSPLCCVMQCPLLHVLIIWHCRLYTCSWIYTPRHSFLAIANLSHIKCMQ